MARCSKCGTTWREPLDEQGDHDCPRCGPRIKTEECDICAECEFDLVTCVQCGARVCPECSQWGCNENDEDCGDWFCEECISKAKESSHDE